MKINFKILNAIILFFIAILLFFVVHKPVLTPKNIDVYKTEEIKINGKIIKVEIADTKEKREKGLSGRASLPEDQGMIFIFPVSDHYSFWMKNMKFSLDFIWINGNEIVEMNRNVKPEDYQHPRSLIPKDKVDKVLEVNAGAAERLSAREGDRVEF